METEWNKYQVHVLDKLESLENNMTKFQEVTIAHMKHDEAAYNENQTRACFN